MLLGTLARKGSVTRVEYTALIFGRFFLLAGLSFFVLRIKKLEISSPLGVPLYLFTRLLFCVTFVSMLESSVVYTRLGGLVDLAVLLTGAHLLLLTRCWPKEGERRKA